MANDLNINWKDGVGEVTDQPLTISPGSGTGNASVSFGSVMNKGLDRTLELEITTPKGESGRMPAGLYHERWQTMAD